MRSRLLAVSFVLLATACRTPATSASGSATTTVPPSPHATGSGEPAAHPPIVVVVLENRDASEIVGSADAPYLNGSFLPAGTRFSNYVAIGHPSLPNYLAMTSGGTQGCSSDGCSTDVYGTDNVFSQLGSDGWRTWAEDMPGPCSRADTGTYAVRHNPALYYTRIAAAECRRNDIPLPRTVPTSFPSLTFVIPNLCHDMHDCSLAVGDAWLAAHVPAYVRAGAVVVIVFDEGVTSDVVFAAASGPGIARGKVDGTAYSHYSLLAGVERAFGLPFLGAAKEATPLPL